MEAYSAEAVVIGAGAVGLACARALARAGLEPLVLESRDTFGSGTSSRNSEVLHAGFHHARGLLKARVCSAGKRLLEAYMTDRGVAWRCCGKLVVARNDDEIARLVTLKSFAEANGVEGISLIDGAAARVLEPELSPDITAALFSRLTGIFDSHGFMLALLGEIEDEGGALVRGAPVLGGEAFKDGVRLQVGGAHPSMLTARIVVNAAGLSADKVAASIDGVPPSAAPRQRYAKGNYFAAPGRSPFQRLIYPAPVSGGLGVHLTFDLGGSIRFGPDVEWLDAEDPDDIDYAVDASRGPAFERSVLGFWPGLPPGSLRPDYAGVRPKLYGPGEPAADFRVDGPERHGVTGLVNLLGIESPGLTSSLALAGEAMARLNATGSL